LFSSESYVDRSQIDDSRSIQAVRLLMVTNIDSYYMTTKMKLVGFEVFTAVVVVRVSGYISRGPGYESRPYQII
jgi:hypothetical protein